MDIVLITGNNWKPDWISHGLLENVRLEGKLLSHKDVIHQVRKSRFAVLPMKVDLLIGTIRECMANGIPAMTNITPSSSKENEKRLSLFSEKGDYQAMADNMCRLLEDADLADIIRRNAVITASERASNAAHIQKWIYAYTAIIVYKKNRTPIPNDLLA